MADLYKEQLIICVKGFPALYDHQRAEYRDLLVKGKCWEVVASQLRLDVNQVKKIWKNLKDSYRQACNIEARRRKSEPLSAPKKKWKFMELMSFLKPFMQGESGSHLKIPAPPIVENGEEVVVEEETEFHVAGIECIAESWEEFQGEENGNQKEFKMENHYESSTSRGSTLPTPSTLPMSSTLPTPQLAMPTSTSSTLPTPQLATPASMSSTLPTPQLAMPTSISSTLPTPQLAMPKPATSAQGRKRKRKVDDVDHIDHTPPEFLPNAKQTRVYLVEKATAESMNDEEGLVGRTVAAALRRLPPYKRALAKVKIHELMLKMEFGPSDGQQH